MMGAQFGAAGRVNQKMEKYQIGLYGLGVMGSSLAKNMIRRGFRTALTSKSEAERARFAADGKTDWKVFESAEAFIAGLEKPRVVFLMITAGKPVDLVLEELLPFLEPGDVVIDGGNSHFTDTGRRCRTLEQRGLHYLGVGVSGGELGALNGPSMMAGGSLKGWDAAKGILQAIAAESGGESCCGYVGPEGAGHYVKMVHNGIEYAILQLLADSYHLLLGWGYGHEKIASVYEGWRRGDLGGYLMDITAVVTAKTDGETGKPLLDCIRDVAGQKGTGSWTLREAMERGVYAPTICEAVFARSFSHSVALRRLGAEVLAHPRPENAGEEAVSDLEAALYAGMICSYAQGIELIRKASDDSGWNVDLQKAVNLWRGGCIIRSKLLSRIGAALGAEPEAPNLLLTRGFSGTLAGLQAPWRRTAARAVSGGLTAPALLSTVTYYDACHTGRMPVNLVQGLRDCFGAHTYERVDRPGSFHTDWAADRR